MVHINCIISACCNCCNWCLLENILDHKVGNVSSLKLRPQTVQSCHSLINLKIIATYQTYSLFFTLPPEGGRADQRIISIQLITVYRQIKRTKHRPDTSWRRGEGGGGEGTRRAAAPPSYGNYVISRAKRS